MSYVDWYRGDREQTLSTPTEFFAALHTEFNFTLDGAAAADGRNALLPRFSSSTAPRVWSGERVFCNPPWSDISPFIDLASAAELAVLLVPARTNARWFHKALAAGAEVRFFLRKLKFGGLKNNSPVDCVLLIFRRGQT